MAFVVPSLQGVGGRIIPSHLKSGEKDLAGAEFRLAMYLLKFGGTLETGG